MWGFWCSPLAYWKRLENSEECSLTLPFLKSGSSCKVKNSNECVFSQTKLEPKERGLFRKSLKALENNGNNYNMMEIY
jgi:hypothetical protein